MPPKPRIIKREIVAESRFFGVEQLHLQFSNGVERVYERLRSPRIPAVMVVALKDEDTVLLIREYAGGMDNYQLSLPKGTLEHAESLFDGACRELKEEVGYGARTFRELKPLSLSPGYMGHVIHVVLAEDLYPERLPGDEPEPIEVVEHRLEDMDSLVSAADFTEARALAALYMVRDLVRARREQRKQQDETP